MVLMYTLFELDKQRNLVIVSVRALAFCTPRIMAGCCKKGNAKNQLRGASQRVLQRCTYDGETLEDLYNLLTRSTLLVKANEVLGAVASARRRGTAVSSIALLVGEQMGSGRAGHLVWS
jgi:hypothetical protein